MRAMRRGSNFVRPTALEAEVAEELVDLIDAAEMVKFAKNGSDVTTAAVRLARAFTGRDIVAVCGDQPFFSTDDWFIGRRRCRPVFPAGVRELTVGFRYNDVDSLDALFADIPGRVAASCSRQRLRWSLSPGSSRASATGATSRAPYSSSTR